MRTCPLLALTLTLGCNLGSRPADAAPPALGTSTPALSPDDGRAAAQSELSTWLAKIPAGHETDYGFTDRAQLSRATLGLPYSVVVFDARRESGPSLDAFTVTGEWSFPVVADGAMRALLTVAKVSGQFKAVDFGAAGLARELDGAEQARGISAKNVARALVRFQLLRADVVAYGVAGSRLDQSAFVPLASGREGLGVPAAAPEWRLDELTTLARARHRALPPSARQ